MKASKLTPTLAVQREKADAAKVLDVVVELCPQAEPVATQLPQSRSERIAVYKEAFSREVAAVEEAIRQVGGEVLGQAWINQTVRARVPAQGVEQLTELDKVAVLDIPHPLKADVG